MDRCMQCGKEAELNGQQICSECEKTIINEEGKEKTVNNITNYPVVNQNKNASKATAGFVLGLVSIVAWIIPLFGFPVTIVGLVMSILGIQSSKKNFAIIGLVLTIVFLVLTILNCIIGSMIGREIGRFAGRLS